MIGKLCRGHKTDGFAAGGPANTAGRRQPLRDPESPALGVVASVLRRPDIFDHLEAGGRRGQSFRVQRLAEGCALGLQQDLE